MSLHEYQIGRALDAQDHPFYALIQAAMRKADTENRARLREAFPHVYRELEQRYNSPGGLLEDER